MRSLAFCFSAIAVVVTRKKMQIISSSLMAMTILSFMQPALGECTLRVLTYNIHHSEGRDSVFDIERIAGVINAASPYAPDLSMVLGRKRAVISGGHGGGRGERGCGWLGLWILPACG